MNTTNSIYIVQWLQVTTSLVVYVRNRRQRSFFSFILDIKTALNYSLFVDCIYCGYCVGKTYIVSHHLCGYRTLIPSALQPVAQKAARLAT